MDGCCDRVYGCVWIALLHEVSRRSPFSLIHTRAHTQTHTHTQLIDSFTGTLELCGSSTESGATPFPPGWHVKEVR